MFAFYVMIKPFKREEKVKFYIKAGFKAYPE